MKRIFIFAGVLFLFSCNTKQEDKTAKLEVSAAPATAAIDQPFTLKKPYRDWSLGNQQNANNYLKALKAYETDNIPECVSYFADSVDINFDELEGRISRDSLARMLSGRRNLYSNVSIEIMDWIPVTSKDGTEEWVTAWYNQTNTAKTGAVDSMSVVQDTRYKAGKIEYIERYQRKKAAK